MALRFNPPPGWPSPPPGWLPPPDWKPDPSWPPAPPGWQYVINDLQDEEPQPWDLPPVARTEQPRRRTPRLTWILAGAAAVVAIAALTETLNGDGNDTAPTSSPTDNAGFTGADRDHASPPPTPSPTPSPTPPSASTTQQPPSPSNRVLRVVSGNMVRVAYQGRATVRVIGIVTPQTVKRGTFSQCSNKSASRYATKLLDGSDVMLRAVHLTGRRLLAQIELAGGSRDFGLAMIRHGYAIHDPTTDPGRLRTAYLAAEADAKAAHRGLWGHCRSLVPDLAAEDSSTPENPRGPPDDSQQPHHDPQGPPGDPHGPPGNPQLPPGNENQDHGGAANSGDSCDADYLTACG